MSQSLPVPYVPVAGIAVGDRNESHTGGSSAASPRMHSLQPAQNTPPQTPPPSFSPSFLASFSAVPTSSLSSSSSQHYGRDNSNNNINNYSNNSYNNNQNSNNYFRSGLNSTTPSNYSEFMLANSNQVQDNPLLPPALKEPPPLRQKTKNSKKWRSICAIGFGVVLLAIAVFLAVHFIILNRPRTIPNYSIVPSEQSLPSLSVKNSMILFPNGTEFRGRGVNVGSWFLLDAVFGGMNTIEEFEFFNVSDARFGQEGTRDLQKFWIENHMSEQDWDFIRYLGFNFVRFPLHFRNFQYADGTWMKDAQGNIDWSLLDAALYNMTSKGLYVQLDFHVWYGRDIEYEAISKAEPWLPADLAAYCSQLREMAADFLKQLVSHVANVPGILGVELLNEAVPSYNNYLMRYLYNQTRAVDPNRILMYYYGMDRQDPTAANWENVVYSFHTYDNVTSGSTTGAQTLTAFRQNVDNKTGDNFPVPYYVSEMHLWDAGDFPAAVSYVESYTKANIPIWALWTYKAVNFDNWALVNYDSGFYVDMVGDSLDKIKSVWARMPGLSLQYSVSSWGREFFP